MISSDQQFFPWWLKNFGAYRAVLFDVDGTLISGGKALPGVSAMFAWLRRHNYPFYLLTNDGNHSSAEKSALLQRAGLRTAPDEIVSCGMAISSLADAEKLRGEKFFVMGDLGVPCYAELAGLLVTRNPKEIDETAGVIVGEGIYDWQENINVVVNSFRKKMGRYFIVPNPDSYWPNGRGGDIGIGAGGKARFICSILEEMNITVKPVYLGKPFPAIFHYTLERLREKFGLDKGIQPRSIIMVGDSLKSDIQGAVNMGFSSALVLSGITSPAQLVNIGRNQQPDWVFQSF